MVPVGLLFSYLHFTGLQCSASFSWDPRCMYSQFKEKSKRIAGRSGLSMGNVFPQSRLPSYYWTCWKGGSWFFFCVLLHLHLVKERGVEDDLLHLEFSLIKLFKYLMLFFQHNSQYSILNSAGVNNVIFKIWSEWSSWNHLDQSYFSLQTLLFLYQSQ